MRLGNFLFGRNRSLDFALGVVLVVVANVAGLQCPQPFHVQRFEYDALDVVAATRVDGVGDVGVQLDAIGGQIPLTAPFIQARATLIAMPRAQVVLVTATGATVGQLSARHGDERALRAFNDLEVTNDETIVKRDAAESLQSFAVAGGIKQFDADFRDDHGTPSQKQGVKKETPTCIL